MFGAVYEWAIIYFSYNFFFIFEFWAWFIYKNEGREDIKEERKEGV